MSRSLEACALPVEKTPTDFALSALQPGELEGGGWVCCALGARIGAMGWLLGLVIWMLAGAPIQAAAETRVIFTVDVESKRTIALPEQVEARCREGNGCSLMAMANALKDRGWSGTFFLNVYEYKRWGEDRLRDIASRLQAAGQDVELHTHPQWAYDPSRWAMFDYDLAEQTKVIRDGVRLLEDWTGLPVVAHRAGAYTANADTLRALVHNGIRLDSSFFWKHPWSRLDGLGLKRNVPSVMDSGLIEIPVTVYEREERPPLLGGLLGAADAVRKVDPDWLTGAAEARAAVDQVIADDLPFLVVFLHSYSFIDASEKVEGPPHLNRHSREIFDVLLDHIARRGLAVVTMRDLAALASFPQVHSANDVIPNVAVEVGWPRYLWGRAKTGGWMALALGAILITAIVGGVLAALALHRRQSARSQLLRP